MIEKSFWISKQRLLTSNWMKIFFFNESGKKDIPLLGDQDLPSFLWNKWWKYRGRRSGYLVRVCRRVGSLSLPSVLLANVQSLENKLDELRYPTNGTFKTVISCVSQSRGWTMKIYIWLCFPCIGRTEQLSLVRWRVGVCVYLSITAGARCLILRKSRGQAHLR
jgi:hypothetical protein